MIITSVNIATRQNLKIGARSFATGIFKQSVEGPVEVTKLGLAGDCIVSEKHHGGPDQAVYLYSVEDYTWWAERLGRVLKPGTFGENLMISGLEIAGLTIGDRLRVGEVELETTAPRIPCQTLETRMGIPGFAKAFRDAERPGFYCRVLREGFVSAGDEVTWKPCGGEVSLLEVFRDYYDPAKDEAAVRRLLSAPIDIRTRTKKEKLLEALQQAVR